MRMCIRVHMRIRMQGTEERSGSWKDRMFLCLALGKDQGVGHSECFRAPCSLSKFSFKPILPQSPSTDPEPAGSGIVQGEENRTPTRSWNRPIAIIPVQEAEIPTVCLWSLYPLSE